MKLPRQSHTFAEFRRSMRSQMMTPTQKNRDQAFDDYIESIWNEHTSSDVCCLINFCVKIDLTFHLAHTHRYSNGSVN